MESDEKYILSRFGNKNHFAVPEGYFEHFQDDILTSVAMLEEEKTVETCPKEDKPKTITLRCMRRNNGGGSRSMDSFHALRTTTRPHIGCQGQQATNGNNGQQHGYAACKRHACTPLCKRRDGRLLYD